jgi:hypothetical protein
MAHGGGRAPAVARLRAGEQQVTVWGASQFGSRAIWVVNLGMHRPEEGAHRRRTPWQLGGGSDGLASGRGAVELDEQPLRELEEV